MRRMLLKPLLEPVLSTVHHHAGGLPICTHASYPLLERGADSMGNLYGADECEGLGGSDRSSPGLPGPPEPCIVSISTA
jgi:hypothetical protein